MTEKKKLWGGRFKKELDEDAKKFSYSLHIDGCLAPYDIQVNLAHAKALHKYLGESIQTVPVGGDKLYMGKLQETARKNAQANSP